MRSKEIMEELSRLIVKIHTSSTDCVRNCKNCYTTVTFRSYYRDDMIFCSIDCAKSYYEGVLHKIEEEIKKDEELRK